jgi:hypothetical protein
MPNERHRAAERFSPSRTVADRGMQDTRARITLFKPHIHPTNLKEAERALNEAQASEEAGGAVSRQTCSTACQFRATAANHLTAVHNAIPKSSAASCRDTPDATASIIRPRKSAEQDFGISRGRPAHLRRAVNPKFSKKRCSDATKVSFGQRFAT